MVVLPYFVTSTNFLTTITSIDLRFRKENLFETDMLRSGVKPSIRRTGAEIIDFLVFRNKSLKEAYGPIVAKNGT